MESSYDKNAAVVVLPPISNGALHDRKLRSWLLQSDLSREPGLQEVLARVVREIGLPYPEAGLGAIRFWGQTGDRPTNWIAAADPVYLEPRLNHLYLRAMRLVGDSAGHLRELLNHLQATLSVDQNLGFTRLGSNGYLSAKSPVATATVPAYVIDRQKPDDFLPTGNDSAEHRTLISEIEMALHEHPINIAREEAGQVPINSLWLWGGGRAPEKSVEIQPPLFTDDALMTGYWYSRTGLAERWPGDIASCLEQSVAGFVAVAPEFVDSPAKTEYWLHELRDALRTGRLSSVTLLFRDGVKAQVRKSHAMRVWRRRSSLLDAEEAG